MKTPVIDKNVSRVATIASAAAILILILAFLAITVRAEGPLVPPSTATDEIGPLPALSGGGFPQPTMKTLHQVEPRIAIDSIPTTIAASGSYYLTQNVSTTTSADGIEITASNVTLDLNGFTISTTTASMSNGIAFATDISGVRVINGKIDGFTTGIDAAQVGHCEFSHLHINDSNTGIFLARSSSCLVSNCTIRGSSNSITGIALVSNSAANPCVGNRIESCTIQGILGSLGRGIEISADGSGALCSGNTITSCTIKDVSRNGINLGAFTGAATVSGNHVTDCTVTATGDNGIRLYTAGGSVTTNSVQNSLVSDAGMHGIFLYADGGSIRSNTVTGCTVNSPSDHGIRLETEPSSTIAGSRIDKCQISSAGTDGISIIANDGSIKATHITRSSITSSSDDGMHFLGFLVGTTIDQCDVSTSGDDGIRLTVTNTGDCIGTRVTNCNVTENIGDGILLADAGTSVHSGWLIQANVIANNGTDGIDTAGSGLIAGNILFNDAFVPSPNSTTGPVVSTTGTLANTGDDAHPWANFVYP